MSADGIRIPDLWRLGGFWNMPTNGATANLAALTSGTVLLVGGITVPARAPISFVSFMSGTTTAATLTNWWFTITTTGRVTLRSTATQGAAAWAANTRKDVALSSTWTPTVDTPVYVGIMVQATTVPSLAGSPAFWNAAGSTNLAPQAFCGNSSTGQTTPPADSVTLTAITAGVNAPWCALS